MPLYKVEYYGDACDKNMSIAISKDTPKSYQAKIKASENPHRARKDIFETIRRKGYWLLNIAKVQDDEIFADI